LNDVQGESANKPAQQSIAEFRLPPQQKLINERPQHSVAPLAFRLAAALRA